MFGGNNGTSDQKRQLLLLEAHILLGYHLDNFLQKINGCHLIFADISGDLNYFSSWRVLLFVWAFTQSACYTFVDLIVYIFVVLQKKPDSKQTILYLIYVYPNKGNIVAELDEFKSIC